MTARLNYSARPTRTTIPPRPQGARMHVAIFDDGELLTHTENGKLLYAAVVTMGDEYNCIRDDLPFPSTREASSSTPDLEKNCVPLESNGQLFTRNIDGEKKVLVVEDNHFKYKQFGEISKYLHSSQNSEYFQSLIDSAQNAARARENSTTNRMAKYGEETLDSKRTGYGGGASTLLGCVACCFGNFAEGFAEEIANHNVPHTHPSAGTIPLETTAPQPQHFEPR